MDLTITASGRRRVKSMSVGGVTGRILGLLDEHGSLSVREVANLGGMSPVVVRSTSRKLIKAGLVRMESNDG